MRLPSRPRRPAAALLCAMAFPAFGGCEVRLPPAGAVLSLEPVVVRAVAKTAHSREAGGGRPLPGPKRPDDPTATAEVRAIWRQGDAIGARDLQAFRQGMPADPQQRLAWLRRSSALQVAVQAAALGIVGQILAWHPELAAPPDPRKAFTFSLRQVARGWQHRNTLVADGWVLPNPPPLDDLAEAMRLLLAWGADPEGGDDWLSPLGVLATTDPSPAAEVAAGHLLAAGASLQSKDGRAPPPLMLAVEKQNDAVVAAILQHRRPAQAELDAALARSRWVEGNRVVALLLEHGADINTRAGERFQPAMQAAVRFRDHGERGPMELALRFKADPNRHAPEGPSPLMHVLHDPELVHGLLALGANPNHRTSAGLTPLMLAAPEDARSIALLVARGARIDPLPDRLPGAGWDALPLGPLSWALVRGNDAAAAALLARDGLDRGRDCGAAFYAAAAGATRSLALLAERGADLAVADDEGRSLLIAAAVRGQVPAVQLLLDRRLARVDEPGPTHIKWERPSGHGFGLALPEPRRVGGYTALELATAAGQLEVVRELLRRGADPRRRGRNGLTPVAYTDPQRHPDLSALLQAAAGRP